MKSHICATVTAAKVNVGLEQVTATNEDCCSQCLVDSKETVYTGSVFTGSDAAELTEHTHTHTPRLGFFCCINTLKVNSLNAQCATVDPRAIF